MINHHHDQDQSLQESETNAATGGPETEPCDPSFLSTASFMNDNSNNHQPNNILLQGPDQSGRSSLAMEFALEMASKSACLCRQSSCVCQPVALLRPDSKAESFPLPCHHHHPLNQESNTTKSVLWNKNLLQKIQVHHFASLQDTLLYLLSLQGKPPQEQPYGAIVVDDMDCMADEAILGAFPMQLSNFLALVLDTVQFLKVRPPVCVTMNSTNSQLFPLDCYMASFFPTVLAIHPKSNSNNHDYSISNHVAVQTSWTVVDRRGTTDTEKVKQLDFIIGHSGSENYQLLWRALAASD